MSTANKFWHGLNLNRFCILWLFRRTVKWVIHSHVGRGLTDTVYCCNWPGVLRFKVRIRYETSISIKMFDITFSKARGFRFPQIKYCCAGIVLDAFGTFWNCSHWQMHCTGDRPFVSPRLAGSKGKIKKLVLKCHNTKRMLETIPTYFFLYI